MKKIFKTSSDVMIYVISIILILTVWLESKLLGVCVITMSLISIALSVLSNEKISFKDIITDINIYYFIVAIVLALSKVLMLENLFYIGLVLFVIVLVLYIIFMIIFKSKDDKNKK